MGDSVVIDGIVTDFVAVMKRIGALNAVDQEAFINELDAAEPELSEDYVYGMNAIAVYFGEE